MNEGADGSCVSGKVGLVLAEMERRVLMSNVSKREREARKKKPKKEGERRNIFVSMPADDMKYTIIRDENTIRV